MALEIRALWEAEKTIRQTISKLRDENARFREALKTTVCNCRYNFLGNGDMWKCGRCTALSESSEEPPAPRDTERLCEIAYWQGHADAMNVIATGSNQPGFSMARAQAEAAAQEGK
jgi:hypothetical protein